MSDTPNRAAYLRRWIRDGELGLQYLAKIRDLAPFDDEKVDADANYLADLLDEVERELKAIEREQRRGKLRVVK